MKNKGNIGGTIRESLGSFKSSFLKSWIPCLLFPTNCKLTHSSPLFLPYFYFYLPLSILSILLCPSISTLPTLPSLLFLPILLYLSTHYSLYCLLKLIKKTDISFLDTSLYLYPLYCFSPLGILLLLYLPLPYVKPR